MCHLHDVPVAQILEQRHLTLKLFAPPPVLQAVQHLRRMGWPPGKARVRELSEYASPSA
jgi:hypothetical protein